MTTANDRQPQVTDPMHGLAGPPRHARFPGGPRDGSDERITFEVALSNDR